MNTLIVADDLSGAADCAVAFGGEAMVLFGDGTETPDVDVLAIDADTRSGSATQAAERTARLFARHAKPGITLFKKFDSTLRGHVAVEIAAALQALRGFHPLIIMTPSFPATGRVLRNGRLYLNGAPLEQTQFWRQENMQGDADLVALLNRAGLDAALTTPADIATTAKNILVCDAGNDADLRAIVEAGHRLGRCVLWAGAGGLARALTNAATKAVAPVLEPVTGNILFLVGSQNAVSRGQAMRFAHDPDVTLIHVTQAMLRDPPPQPATRETVLMLDGTHETDRHALARAFAAWAAPSALTADALFLTGGETAHAMLGVLGAHGMRLLGETAPGVTLGRAEGGSIHGRAVVTKAGAFGNADTIRRCRDVLRGRTVPLE